MCLYTIAYFVLVYSCTRVLFYLVSHFLHVLCKITEIEQGGFKKDESRDVPLPFDFTTALKDVVQGVVKDVNGIKRGEAPGRTTLGLLLAAGFVLIFLLSFVMPSPRPVKKKAASRVKAD